MKILLLIRHAKAEHPSPGQSDEARKLSDRGKGEAKDMAQEILRLGLSPSHMLCSPAKRTWKTAQIMAREWSLTESSIVTCDSLYEGTYESYLDQIGTFKEEVTVGAIVGHNPTIGWLVQELTATPIDSFPTCATAILQVNSESWKLASRADITLMHLLRP